MAFKANPQANKSEKPKESLFITVPKTILAAVGVFFFIILAIALRDNRKDD